MPTNPHQFYYYEADLLLSEILVGSMRVLELGCGTGGSTAIHSREVTRLMATDFSTEMVRRTARKLRRRRASVPDFAVAEACHLPFRDASFDAVISRGVLLSYLRSPEDMLAEMHRVLRPDGKVGLDAMNRIRGASPKVSRGFCLMAGGPHYMESFVRNSRQVRLLFALSEDSPFAVMAREKKSCERRPHNLRKYVVSEARYEGHLFRSRELKALMEGAGFRDVRITPLGHLAYSLGWKDAQLLRFVSTNRARLSRLILKLSDHLRPETGWHLFASASRN